MDKKEVHFLIREIVQDESTRMTKHCRDQMKARKVTMDDFMYVLMWGKLTEFKINPEDAEIKCKIVGKDLDGDDLSLVVVILEDEPAVMCITVHG